MYSIVLVSYIRRKSGQPRGPDPGALSPDPWRRGAATDVADCGVYKPTNRIGGASYLHRFLACLIFMYRFFGISVSFFGVSVLVNDILCVLLLCVLIRSTVDQNSIFSKTCAQTELACV